jgi:hypothetical protein
MFCDVEFCEVDIVVGIPPQTISTAETVYEMQVCIFFMYKHLEHFD